MQFIPPIQYQFQQVVQKVQYQPILRKEPVVLETGFVYFFVERGAVYRKETNGKTEQSIKNKDKTFLTAAGKMTKHHQPKQVPKLFAREYDSYECPLNLSKYLQDIYYSFNAKPSVALSLNLTDLKACTLQKIRELNLAKLRLIAAREQMRGIEKLLIIEKLHRFQYLQLQFGQVLYNYNIRPQYIFFLKNGQVEVIQGRKKQSGYIINAKTSLGWDKQPAEWARCVSEKIQCYAIKLDQLTSFFPSVAQTMSQKIRKSMNNCDLQQFRSTCSQFQTNEQSAVSTPLGNNHLEVNIQPLNRNSTARRRNQHRSMQNIKDGEKKQYRRLALRRHFSNYYNEVFDEFSEKKKKQMGGLDNQQNFNLYQIKMKQRKAPQMDKLKTKLKRIRLQKIQECKQKMQKKPYIYSLTGIKVTIIDQQD